MAHYVAFRLLQAAILLVGVSAVAFALMHLAPGGPLALYTLNPTVTAQDLTRLVHQLGLDQPVYIQYIKWGNGILTGNWGYSFFGGRPVLNIILERIPATLELMASSIGLAIIVGATIGTAAALRRHSVFDYLVTTLAVVALSLPTFWFGLITIYVFSLYLRWLPAGGIQTTGEAFSVTDNLRHLLLPMAVLGFVLVAHWSRYTRSAMLDVLGQDYLRTAHAKGLHRHTILIHHAVRSMLPQLITLAGLQLPALLGGALVTETVFSWPGMGLLFVNALSSRDYPVLMGILMVTAILVVIGSLLADLAVAWIDPRVALTARS